jgi:hypothetical protein
MIIPQVASVTAIETKALAYEKIFLPGLPKHIGTPIHIMENTILSDVDQESIDVKIRQDK